MQPTYPVPAVWLNASAKARVLDLEMMVLSRSKKAAVVPSALSTDVSAIRQHRGKHQNAFAVTPDRLVTCPDCN
jgi:hypothetical protein